MGASTNSTQLQNFYKVLVYSVFSMYCIKMLDLSITYEPPPQHNYFM